MATLREALISAHEAGDYEAAELFAQMIKEQEQQQPERVASEESAPINPAEGFKTTLQLGPLDTGIELPESISKILAGQGASLQETAQGIRQLAGYAGFQDEDLLSEIQRTKELEKPLLETTEGFIGKMTGDVAQMAGGPGGSAKAAALTAGLFGLARPSEDGDFIDNVISAGQGAAFGAGSQKASEVLFNVAKPFVGQIPKSVMKTANKFGIKFDLAQTTGGGGSAGFKKALQNLPATGAKQRALADAQQKAFNRAVLSKAGIDADSATEEVIKKGFQQLGDKFDDTLKGGRVVYDDSLNDALDGLLFRASNEIEAGKAELIGKMVNRVFTNLDEGMEINGSVYASLRRGINETTSRWSRSADKSELAEFGGELVNILDDAVTGINKAQYKDIRQQYAILSNLVNKNIINNTGDISGPKFYQATKNFNKKAFAQGNLGETGDLARIGKFLQDTQPDSGTAKNLLTQGLLSGGVGGVAGLTAGTIGGQDATDALKVAALFGGGTFAAQKIGQAFYNSNLFKDIITKQTLPQKGVAAVVDAIEQEAGFFLGEPIKKIMINSLRTLPVAAGLEGVEE